MLSLEKISFSYPNGHEIFKGLSLSLPMTGLVHLQGSNGSGKTTLFRILSHLITIKEGNINFNHIPFTDKMVSYMPAEANSSFLNLTGEETLLLFNRLNFEKTNEIPFETILQKHPIFQEALNTRFFKSSTGMKQIINFLRTLSKKAEVYILDEPLNSIDKAGKKIFYEVLDELKKNHLVIMSSHEELDISFTKKLLLSNGEIREIN